VLSFGDDMMAVGEFLKLSVEAYSLSENWINGTSVITHWFVFNVTHGQEYRLTIHNFLEYI
jgi:hypothetical protein